MASLITLTDTDLMPFGNHKGKQMQRVPEGYLAWLRTQKWLEERFPEVADYIDKKRGAP